MPRTRLDWAVLVFVAFAVLACWKVAGCAGSVPETPDVVNGSFGIPRYSHPAESETT